MRFFRFAVLLLVAAPLHAITPLDEECAAYRHLGALYELRSLLLTRGVESYQIDRFFDERIEALREPLGEGEFRWVRWVIPSGDGPVEKDGHAVTAVHDRGDPDRFEDSSSHVFAVRIVVPRKRSLLNANNPVYVGDVVVRATTDGRTRTIEKPVNAWMNPDTSRTIDLGGIADHVDVTYEAATSARHSKEAHVEVHFRQAVAEDDPANPSFGTIQALNRIRSRVTPVTVDSEIAALERTLFPAADSLPLLTIINDFRLADELMRSKKEEEQVKGEKLLRETIRRLR